MGKDYRIGLIAGSILAGIAIVWVATRPSLAPRPPGAPPSQDASSASEVNQPKPQEPGPVVSPQREAPDTGRPVAVQNAVPGSSGPTASGKDEPAQRPRLHIVRPGETLSALSQQYYGTPNSWRKLLAANEKVIKDANKIAPGTRLIIPP